MIIIKENIEKDLQKSFDSIETKRKDKNITTKKYVIILSGEPECGKTAVMKKSFLKFSGAFIVFCLMSILVSCGGSEQSKSDEQSGEAVEAAAQAPEDTTATEAPAVEEIAEPAEDKAAEEVKEKPAESNAAPAPKDKGEDVDKLINEFYKTAEEYGDLINKAENGDASAAAKIQSKFNYLDNIMTKLKS